jgi:integrase
MPLPPARQAEVFGRVGKPLPTSLRDGVPIEVVSKLLGHADLTTTASVYGHLTVEDARVALEQAGWFTGQEVRL